MADAKDEKLNDEDFGKVLGTVFAIASFGEQQQVPADVTIWLAKDPGGKWIIRFVRAKIRKK
jgi:hypothetical protein